MELNNYMDRLYDREKGVPHTSPILLPPRPAPPSPSKTEISPKKPITIANFIPPQPEERKKLEELFFSSVSQPASESWSSFPKDKITEVIPGKAWVFYFLSAAECEDIILQGEQHGLEYSMKKTYRTSSRTNDFMLPSLSISLGRRLPSELLDILELTAPHTNVRGIHPNWRVAKYCLGESFGAHFDNSDTLTVTDNEGKREHCTSSHTLLIALSDRATFGGGATRLFPTGKYDEGSVDVKLPQGFALVFQQKGMLHAGLAVTMPTLADRSTDAKESVVSKYIAQAGLIRGQSDLLFAPSLFKYGPGLTGDTYDKPPMPDIVKKSRKDFDRCE